MTMQHQIINK